MNANNEVAINNRPSELITLAIDKGADLEKLEKLLEIQERYESNIAKKEYHIAMAAFKENPPQIDKDRTVSFGSGKTSYKHASLYNVTLKISAALSKHGLSASWTTKSNGVISVTCKITHVKGHSEETTLTAPSDVSGSKNAIQAIGSTITYLERYTLLALCGLATYDSDDDGVGAVSTYVDDKELLQLEDMINDREVDIEKFLKFMHIESLDKCPKDKFKFAMDSLQRKEKK